MYRWLITILFIMFIALQYRLWFGEANVREVWTLKREIASQKEENQTLSLRNQQLEAEIKDLKNGLSALEERARSELGMIKEGETFFQLVEPGQHRQKE
jgi:cell division protein FtsB